MSGAYGSGGTAATLRSIGEPSKDERPAIPERLLWKLWKRRAARQDEFRTGAGARVRVLYPGRAGTAAGPDFRDALLDVEGLGLVRGDVEIHRRQRDWDAHGHSDDPNYNGVALHAALEVDGPDTTLHSGTAAPVVSLSGLLSGANDVESASPEDTRAAPGLWDMLVHHGYKRPESESEVGALLDRAGDERFRRKAALLGRFAAEQGPEQTLYEALLEGLGYRHNQQPFVKLAQAAPIAALRRAALPVLAEQRPMVLRHWLLAISGLADGASDAPSRLPPGLGTAMERKEWRLFRVRPANHPAARIEGVAELVARFLERGLLAGLADSAGSPSQLTAALTVDGRRGGVAPVGEGRARDLAVNIVVPLLHSLDGDAKTSYLALYRRFPKLQDNEVLREMVEQLLPEEWHTDVNNARRQQGLLRLAALLRGGS
jgi:hypothetical protein